MNIELSILDWIQTLHTPFLDKIMVFITRLGDAGIIWIVLSIVLLLIPKTRKSGAVMVAALVVDVLLCAGMSDRNIEVISVCTLSDRCSWRNSVRCDFRIFGISQSIEMKMTKDYRPGIIWKSVGISIILHEFYKNSSLRR